jgi:hypothetical protein
MAKSCWFGGQCAGFVILLASSQLGSAEQRAQAAPDWYCRVLCAGHCRENAARLPPATHIGALQLLGLRVDPALCNPNQAGERQTLKTFGHT